MTISILTIEGLLLDGEPANLDDVRYTFSARGKLLRRLTPIRFSLYSL